MDRDVLLALAPHYAVMLLLVFAILRLWRTYLGELNLIWEFVLIAAIVFSYRPIVTRLGLAPEPWQE